MMLIKIRLAFHFLYMSVPLFFAFLNLFLYGEYIKVLPQNPIQIS